MRIIKFGTWGWFEHVTLSSLYWTVIITSRKFRKATKAMQALNVELGKLGLDECDGE